MATSRASSRASARPTALARWGDVLLARASRAPDLLALLAMALLGLGISVYLTTVHYAKVPLVCNTTGIINCARVTSSAYSVIPGTQLPITIPGMLWFVVSGALAVVAWVALARGQAEPERLRLAHVIWGALGLAFVLYLVYAEIVQLRQICEWCTAVHILTLLTFLIALARLQRAQTEVDAAPAANPAANSSPTARRSVAASPSSSSATRSSATRSSATRSSATRSSATRSSLTRPGRQAPRSSSNGSDRSNRSNGASGSSGGTGAARGGQSPARGNAPLRRP